MKKIIVAGAGHGGLVAAKALAEAGYDVTVYEKKQEDGLGYPQYDSVHLDGFEKAGVPIPEAYKVKRTGLTFVIPGADLPPLKQGVSDDTYNVEIDRKALYRWLLEPAKTAGVCFRFGCAVQGPILLGSRVAGLKTDDGDVYADLVIDAAGMYSPVRTQLPEYLGIQNELNPRLDVMHTYRAFFRRNKELPDPENKYVVSLVPGAFCGLFWAITGEEEIDVLIASLSHPLTDEDITEKTAMVRQANPAMGAFLRGGRGADIPVRQPLSMLIADGYAAVGDAAFMAIPLKGSGVGYAMRAGKMLADTVIADENGCCTRETLWGYQLRFFKEIGFTSSLMAVIKNEMPLITQEDMEYFFREGLVSSEVLEAFGSEAKFSRIIGAFSFKELREKAKKIVGHPYVRGVIVRGGKNITRALMVQQSLKEKYDPASAAKWNAAYNGLFEGIQNKIEKELEHPGQAPEEQE